MNIIEIVNKGRFAPLSNFSNSYYANKPFKSVAHEHYFNMAASNKLIQSNIKNIKNMLLIFDTLGFEIYKRCASIVLFNKNYDIEKTHANLWAAIYLKLIKSPSAVNLLLSTGDKVLHMMSGTDNIIGIGKGRRGLNLTGKILMQLREHFLNVRMVKIKRECNFTPIEDFEFAITPVKEMVTTCNSFYTEEEDHFRYF